jgi:hypothetical protein
MYLWYELFSIVQASMTAKFFFLKTLRKGIADTYLTDRTSKGISYHYH